MAQITQYAANRISAGSRSGKYPASQGVGNDPVWACVLPSDPHAEAFATPRATARSARLARAGSVQQQRDDRAGVATASAPVIVDVRPAPVAVVKPEARGVSMRVDTLTDSDVSNLKAIFEHEISGSTLIQLSRPVAAFPGLGVGKGCTGPPRRSDPGGRLPGGAHPGTRPQTRNPPGGRVGNSLRPQDRPSRRSLRQPGGEEDPPVRDAQSWKGPETGGGAHPGGASRHRGNGL